MWCFFYFFLFFLNLFYNYFFQKNYRSNKPKTILSKSENNIPTKNRTTIPPKQSTSLNIPADYGMIKTIKLHLNKNEIFLRKKNAESKETKTIFSNNAASVIKNKNCNFYTSFQHIDIDADDGASVVVVGNDKILSRDVNFINKNYGCRENFNDKMGNEENEEKL